ncbi:MULTISPECIES: sugar kinase [Paenibacillus]|uniref:2-dehydro-3-deoxygluconokinase n=1 Tax=Paenibacillus campinasensis TaxID=66347 RepID=A0A268EPB6_9BACL|nr:MULTISPECIES: sugar kinase [Paenibacillus]MUG66135.1 sugar kinase [Paenibacillus campinasensis]PAD74968.1 2-dehydro-3-deoxygluconokinase [Paenibacillus campinasensis]PAK50200.1 2-dehydro-3-deoxygluconokinase [Paenibacillus sp. 7541]
MALGNRKFDVITFGESMGLFYPEGARGIGQGGSMAQSFGGAESNLAIGLARLGCSSGWFGQLGQDPIGTGILKTLRGEGVDVTAAKQTDKAPTGLMLRQTVRGQSSVYYYRAGSAASVMTPDDIDPEYIGQARIVHFTGITAALSSSCLETIRHVIAVCKERGVKLSFDPNLRLKLWSIEQARPVLLELAQSCDYFLPGYDECKLLFETEDEREIIRRLREFPAMTVIKSIGDRNVLLNGSDTISLPFEKVEHVVDTVGAGDGFCAGFLAGIAKGWSPEEALSLGGLTGSMVIQAMGDWEALPTWDEVEQRRGLTAHIER